VVVVTVGAVWVAVLDLFVGSVSQGLDRHLEVQGLAGEGVIWIDRNRVFGDASNEKRDLPARIIVRNDLHSGR
jgi:hypothetical protein